MEEIERLKAEVEKLQAMLRLTEDRLDRLHQEYLQIKEELKRCKL